MATATLKPARLVVGEIGDEGAGFVRERVEVRNFRRHTLQESGRRILFDGVGGSAHDQAERSTRLASTATGGSPLPQTNTWTLPRLPRPARR
jgi:hypothetical protein